MTQEEFEREMIDLQRYELRIRIYELEQENKSLQELALLRAAELASLSRDFKQQERELASFRLAQGSKPE